MLRASFSCRSLSVVNSPDSTVAPHLLHQCMQSSTQHFVNRVRLLSRRHVTISSSSALAASSSPYSVTSTMSRNNGNSNGYNWNQPTRNLNWNQLRGYGSSSSSSASSAAASSSANSSRSSATKKGRLASLFTGSSSTWASTDVRAYLTHYPGQKQWTNACKNMDFYQGKISSAPSGGTIDHIHTMWKGDYDRLEDHHGYIQWLFPIREAGLNSQAQVLYLHEIAAIRADPVARKRLLKSYDLMLDFYGMRLVNASTGELARTAGYQSRYGHLNQSTHNYLRITRILKCLGELGYEYLKLGFLLHVVKEITEGAFSSGSIGRSARDYWFPILRSPTDQTFLQNLIKELKEEEAASIEAGKGDVHLSADRIRHVLDEAKAARVAAMSEEEKKVDEQEEEERKSNSNGPSSSSSNAAIGASVAAGVGIAAVAGVGAVAARSSRSSTAAAAAASSSSARATSADFDPEATQDLDEDDDVEVDSPRAQDESMMPSHESSMDPTPQTVAASASTSSSVAGSKRKASSEEMDGAQRNKKNTADAKANTKETQPTMNKYFKK